MENYFRIRMILLIIILGGAYYATHVWLDELYMQNFAINVSNFMDTDEEEDCTWYTDLNCLAYYRLHSLIDNGYLETKKPGLLKKNQTIKITKVGHEKYKS